MTEQRIQTGTRLGSMLLDHIFMCLIMVVLMIPLMVTTFSHAFTTSHEEMNPATPSWIFYVVLLFIAIYLGKDSINGRSLAKRITKLQVVENSTGQVASPLRCLIRNLFIIIWPIEVISAMINTERRIGDRVAGTKLVAFDPTKEQPKTNIKQIILTLVIAYFSVLVIFYPIHSFQSGLFTPNVDYVASSYNEQESKEVEKLFADSMSNDLSADIRVYDTVKHENLKFISIVFNLKSDYFESEREYEHLKSRVNNLLFTKFPKNSFVGQAKFVFKEPGHMESRWTKLDWRKESGK